MWTWSGSSQAWEGAGAGGADQGWGHCRSQRSGWDLHKCQIGCKAEICCIIAFWKLTGNKLNTSDWSVILGINSWAYYSLLALYQTLKFCLEVIALQRLALIYIAYVLVKDSVSRLCARRVPTWSTTVQALCYVAKEKMTIVMRKYIGNQPFNPWFRRACGFVFCCCWQDTFLVPNSKNDLPF